MNGWLGAVLVAVGAGLGAPARHLTNVWLRRRFDTTPTAGTLAVNVMGSFVLGLLAGASVEAAWWALIGIGFCGAYTTFSTLALELWAAFEEDRHRHAVINAALSLALGVGAAAAGWLLTH